MSDFVSSLTPAQSARLFNGCLVLVAGFALSIGMGFLLGPAGGWLTFAFLCLVFALGIAHLRKKVDESTDKTEPTV